MYPFLPGLNPTAQGEPRFQISWSKTSKKLEEEPVLEKSYEYLRGHTAQSNIPGHW